MANETLYTGPTVTKDALDHLFGHPQGEDYSPAEHKHSYTVIGRLTQGARSISVGETWRRPHGGPENAKGTRVQILFADAEGNPVLGSPLDGGMDDVSSAGPTIYRPPKELARVLADNGVEPGTWIAVTEFESSRGGQRSTNRRHTNFFLV